VCENGRTLGDATFGGRSKAAKGVGLGWIWTQEWPKASTSIVRGETFGRTGGDNKDLQWGFSSPSRRVENRPFGEKFHIGEAGMT